MEIRQITRRLGSINEIVNGARNTDVASTTLYFGVELIGEFEYTVTREYTTEIEVVEPGDQEKGDAIGKPILARLREIDQERSIITASEPETEQALVIESAYLRKMLR